MSTIEKAVEKMRKMKGNSQQDSAGSLVDTGALGRQRLAESDSKGRMCKLDSSYLSKYGYLTTDVQDTQLAEEYRAIKRPLLMHISGKAADRSEYANLIMVVSALPGEGKTYTAMNLAISMAMEKNFTVMLVDCDVVKPALSESLGLDGHEGLIDVLSDDNKSISEVIYKTNISKLTLVPSGRPDSHSTELLSSRKMEKICHELSSRYPDRVIIFDAPPLLMTSHARVLSHLAGQIVFVTEAGKTLQHEITEAVSQLDQDKIVGLVLNKSRKVFSTDYSYGSYAAASGQE